MLKGIKSLVNKIKFKFKGSDNEEFEFTGQQINYLPLDEELITEIDEEDIKLYQVESDKLDIPHIENIFDINKIGKGKKLFLLRQMYGKDKGHLIHILLNTRKPRVKKKIIKRIMN